MIWSKIGTNPPQKSVSPSLTHSVGMRTSPPSSVSDKLILIMNAPSHETLLRELHQSLDERWRPEDVAKKIRGLLDVTPTERCTLAKAVKVGRENLWSSMSADFHRPQDMSRQLAVAGQLFGAKVEFAPDDVQKIEEWIKQIEASIGKEFGHNDFKYDRLPKEERKKAGIEISRRQYNKRFRLAARLERKARKLAREQFKRSLTLASKNCLAAGSAGKIFPPILIRPVSSLITSLAATCGACLRTHRRSVPMTKSARC